MDVTSCNSNIRTSFPYFRYEVSCPVILSRNMVTLYNALFNIRKLAYEKLLFIYQPHNTQP